MSAATEFTATRAPATAARIDAAEPVSTSRHETADRTTATLERHRLRGALLNAIVKNEARRREADESQSMESVPTDGTAISRVEAAQA